MKTIADLASGYTDEPGYFDFARWGPISRAVADEQRSLVEVQARARFGSEIALTEQSGRVVRAVSSLIGFAPDHVVFQPNTSEGLMHTLFGLTGQVLMSPRDYPSMPVAAARSAEALRVLEPVWMDLDHDVVTPAVVQRHLTDSVTAVAVSLVDYRTGYLVDLEGIRQVIGDRLLIVDAIQGFGVVDAPWSLADVVLTGGQKWLRAGWGTGFSAFSDRALSRLSPVLSGIGGSELELGGSYEVAPPPLPGAAAFRLGNPDPIAQARLATSLEQLAEVGVAAVSDAVAERAARLLELADEAAVPVASPRDPAERAGIVVLEPAPDQLTTLTAALLNHGVTARVRAGTIRLSAHVSTGEDTFSLLRSALTSSATTVLY